MQHVDTSWKMSEPKQSKNVPELNHKCAETTLETDKKETTQRSENSPSLSVHRLQANCTVGTSAVCWRIKIDRMIQWQICSPFVYLSETRNNAGSAGKKNETSTQPQHLLQHNIRESSQPHMRGTAGGVLLEVLSNTCPWWGVRWATSGYIYVTLYQRHFFIKVYLLYF